MICYEFETDLRHENRYPHLPTFMPFRVPSAPLNKIQIDRNSYIFNELRFLLS